MKSHIYKKIFLNNAGWSMTEVVIAVVVLVMGIFPLMRLINGISKGTEMRRTEFYATVFAEQLMETIKQKKWDENSVIPHSQLDDAHKTPVASLGNDSESFTDFQNNAFDDIDDFNGVSHSPLLGIFYDITVEYVKDDGNGKMIPSSTVENFKQISITTRIEKSSKQTFTITTIMANMP